MDYLAQWGFSELEPDLALFFHEPHKVGGCPGPALPLPSPTGDLLSQAPVLPCSGQPPRWYHSLCLSLVLERILLVCGALVETQAELSSFSIISF